MAYDEEEFNTEKALLDAVNILLESINELPIEDEQDFDVLAEARMARSKIFEVKRAVLAEGWDLNRDTNYSFPRDVQGFIPIPANVLDISGNSGDVIMRNWRLYSKSAQSHKFEEDVACEVLWDLDFNGLTHPIRHYITIRAARIFANRVIGDKSAHAFTEVDEEDARIAARRSEGRTGQYNMLTSGQYGTNFKVTR